MLWIVGGCLGGLEPEVGPLGSGACTDEDGDPDNDVSFADDVLTPLFSRSRGGCMACHDPAGSTPTGVSIGGLDLTSYAKLREGGVNSGADIVVPEAPCESVLVEKLSEGPSFGGRMPLSGPFFVEEEIHTVADWIAEGADDN
jgi:hypothetical protein